MSSAIVKESPVQDEAQRLYVLRGTGRFAPSWLKVCWHRALAMVACKVCQWRGLHSEAHGSFRCLGASPPTVTLTCRYCLESVREVTWDDFERKEEFEHGAALHQKFYEDYLSSTLNAGR